MGLRACRLFAFSKGGPHFVYNMGGAPYYNEETGVLVIDLGALSDLVCIFINDEWVLSN